MFEWWLARGLAKSKGRGDSAESTWHRWDQGPTDNNTLDLPWRPIDCTIHPHRILLLCPSASAPTVRCACRLLSLSLPFCCAHRVLLVPARSAVVEGCCPPVLAVTPNLPLFQSLCNLSDRRHLHRRRLRLQTLRANIPPPPQSTSLVLVQHHHDHICDLTRPARPRHHPQHVVFIIQRRRRALPRRQEDWRGFFWCHLRGHQPVEQHPGRH